MTRTDFSTQFMQCLRARRSGDALGIDLPGWVTHPGFDVYANTGLNACLMALKANFPSVAHWLGPASFTAVASTYARTHPPVDARLFLYGEGFAGWLASLEPVSDWPYLAELGTLDRAWVEAQIAADSPPADLAQIADSLEHLGPDTRLQPAPSTRWHYSTEMPIWDLWTRAREGQSASLTVPWEPQGVLLTRPDDAVLVHPLNAAQHAFLHACGLGETLAQAAAAAQSADPCADLGDLLVTLFTQSAFCGPSDA